jgi:hypothetical protein
VTPGFTAEHSLQPADGHYRAGLGARGGSAVVTPAASSASGVPLGTHCIGHVQSVVVGDFDEHGHLVNWHIVDEVGSC